jgi:hypothetical protein
MTCQAMVSAMAKRGLWQSPGGNQSRSGQVRLRPGRSVTKHCLASSNSPRIRNRSDPDSRRGHRPASHLAVARGTGSQRRSSAAPERLRHPDRNKRPVLGPQRQASRSGWADQKDWGPRRAGYARLIARSGGDAVSGFSTDAGDPSTSLFGAILASELAGPLKKTFCTTCTI